MAENSLVRMVAVSSCPLLASVQEAALVASAKKATIGHPHSIKQTLYVLICWITAQAARIGATAAASVEVLVFGQCPNRFYLIDKCNIKIFRQQLLFRHNNGLPDDSLHIHTYCKVTHSWDYACNVRLVAFEYALTLRTFWNVKFNLRMMPSTPRALAIHIPWVIERQPLHGHNHISYERGRRWYYFIRSGKNLFSLLYCRQFLQKEYCTISRIGNSSIIFALAC